MRTSHIFLGAVAVATIAFVVTAPGAAQMEMAPGAAPIDRVEPKSPDAQKLAPDKKAQYDAWPPDRKAAFNAWPAETKAYYWTLPKPRQNLFWQIPDEDKIALTAMTGPERDKAWQMIEARTAEEGGPI